MMRGWRSVVACSFALAMSWSAMAGSRRYVGHFRVTYYYVAVEDARYDGEPAESILLDIDGCEIARVSQRYRRALDLEGTGRLADGRIVNVAERAGDGWRYVDLGPASWGLGVEQVPLLPFRSVAADPKHLRTGMRLYLPAFSELLLDDGGVVSHGARQSHGGHFTVDDVGSAIREARLDIFIGDEAQLERFEAVVPSHGRTPVYVVESTMGGDGHQAADGHDEPIDLLRSR